MFKKSVSIELKPQRAYSDACLSMFKRVKFCGNGFLVCENDYENFTIHYIDYPTGKEINKWTVSVTNGLISDYICVNGNLYVSFINVINEYDEIFAIYRSDDKGDMVQVFSCHRESYQHDMNYYSLFESNGECRLLLIRHNRVHLYSIGSYVREINVLEGQKWYISNNYSICSIGRDWEIYNPELELITSFKFDEDVDWLEVASLDKDKLIAVATNNSATEIGGLFVYDKQRDNYDIHYQRYGFYGASICHGKIWATVSSIYSGIGGLMIFDKSACLKFAHLRDEDEGNAIRGYNPAPIVYQSSCISELHDNKVAILDYERIIVSDITCRPLQEIKHQGYDCVAISNDAKTIVILELQNRLLGGQPEVEYNSSLNIYTWDSVLQKGSVVDLNTFRK